MKFAVPMLAVAGIAALWSPPTPVLIWNASASAPLGLYELQHPNVIGRGELVLAEPPANARDLAAARGYLPAGIPLVKRIAALVWRHSLQLRRIASSSTAIRWLRAFLPIHRAARFRLGRAASGSRKVRFFCSWRMCRIRLTGGILGQSGAMPSLEP